MSVQSQWMGAGVSSECQCDSQISVVCEPVVVGVGVGAGVDARAVISAEASPAKINLDGNLGVVERVCSAAGAAILSAIIVNPLDVAKTRLQAQAAGVAYSHPLSNLISRMQHSGPNMIFADLRCSPSCTRAGVHGTVSICPPDCFRYKGTLDVFSKIVHQEGLARLWRGTNAGLALAIPTVVIYLPCYDLFRNRLEELCIQNAPSMKPYVPLVAGSLARSLACATCYPIELARTRMQAFKCTEVGKSPPGVFKTLLDIMSNVKSTHNMQNRCKHLYSSSSCELIVINLIGYFLGYDILIGLIFSIHNLKLLYSMLYVQIVFHVHIFASYSVSNNPFSFNIGQNSRKIQTDPVSAINRVEI